jgi:hypothetical protein
MERYSNVIFGSERGRVKKQGAVESKFASKYLENINIDLNSPCEEWPYQDMDESCTSIFSVHSPCSSGLKKLNRY